MHLPVLHLALIAPLACESRQAGSPSSSSGTVFDSPSDPTTVFGADSTGTGSASLPIPGFTRSGRPYLVVGRIADGAGSRHLESISDLFLVLARGDTVTVRGTISTGAGGCPSLRSPPGVRYAVHVEGVEVLDGDGELEIRSVAPDISVCSR